MGRVMPGWPRLGLPLSSISPGREGAATKWPNPVLWVFSVGFSSISDSSISIRGMKLTLSKFWMWSVSEGHFLQLGEPVLESLVLYAGITQFFQIDCGSWSAQREPRAP